MAGFFDFLIETATLGLVDTKTFNPEEEEGIGGFKLPEFFEDPEFKKTQEFLSDFGINILQGNIPEFFKPLGETGSKQFEDVLALTKRDITESALETAAITNRGRGGSVASTVAREVGDATTKLRFADFLRAMEGKGFLFQQGRGITEGVRSAGLTNQGQRNTFNLGTAGIDLKSRGLLDEQDAQSGDLLGKIIGGVLGLSTGGAAGAAAGTTVGGDIFGSIVDFFKKDKSKKLTTTPDPDKKLNLGGINLFDAPPLAGSVR